MSKPSRQTIFLTAIAAGGTIGLALLLFLYDNSSHAENLLSRPSRLTLADIPFDGERAYGYLKEICAIGRRPSGSPGMKTQQQLLANHFNRLGGAVRFQKFRIRHPQDGSPVPMANLIVQWHPRTSERILLCAHYDTRPYPDRDVTRPRGTFVGANDGASGVAVLMELAHEMGELKGPVGVDFVLFDGEELVFDDARDRYFLGSEFFAREYVTDPPDHRYRWGVLLDMVGDASLQLYHERNSARWPETRPLVQEIWSTAERLGVREFVSRPKYEIRDDHLQLRNRAKIPTCNVIDFDFPHWHTEGDTPDKCSALSLAKVGWVIQEWLREEVRQ